MSRRFPLSALALLVTTIAAGAADLPSQSRLGAIFAEPPEVRPDPGPPGGFSAPVVGYNSIPNPLWARGGYSYGSYFSYFHNGPYYGGGVPYVVRLPYVCGFYGYC